MARRASLLLAWLILGPATAATADDHLAAWKERALVVATQVERIDPELLPQPNDALTGALRQARHLAETGERLRALARLRLIVDAQPSNSAAALELAGQALRYGATATADALLAGLDISAAQASAGLRLQQADRLLQRGQLAAAKAALASTEPALQSEAWQALHFQLLLAEARYGEAGEIVAGLGNDTGYLARARYYNFGIALIRDGRGDQGATALDRVGSLASNDPALQALADRANLALAYQLLDRGKADSALPVLGRIRSAGPYANRAILAYGWAWLLPGGAPLARVALGDERSQGPPPESFAGQAGAIGDRNLYQRYRIRPFVRASIPTDESARLERALAAWAALIDRDSGDPAVLDGLLAIADALARLGAHADALRFRERALTALDTERQRLQAAMRLADTGSWIEALQQDDTAEPGGDWQLRALPGPALARYLGEALASQPFQTALQDLHDYAALQNSFAALDRRLAGNDARADSGTAVDAVSPEVSALRGQLDGWRAELEADRQDQRAALRAMALEVLTRQAERINRRLADTRLTLARQFDNGAAGR